MSIYGPAWLGGGFGEIAAPEVQPAWRELEIATVNLDGIVGADPNLVLPPVGDTLRYESFLGGKLRYTSRGEPFFEPDVKRESSLTQFYRFMKVCMHNTSYANLAANCDSVAADDLESVYAADRWAREEARRCLA